MIGVIQMKKPVAESPDYYLGFYNMYNLLQINDAIIYRVFEEAKENYQLTTSNLLESISTDNYAKELLVQFRMTGITPPDNVIKMSKENRGTDTSLAYDLQANDRDPFDWFRKTNEFLQLYALFEQALRELLRQKGCKNISESKAIDLLIEKLDSQTSKFIGILAFKVFGLVENVDEVKAIWDYYTQVRNCIAHSGGRITQKVVDGFNKINSSYGNIFEAIQNKDFLSCYFLVKEDDEYKLFDCKCSSGEIIHLDNNSLNFFRMFCVFVVESLAEMT